MKIPIKLLKMLPATRSRRYFFFFLHLCTICVHFELKNSLELMKKHPEAFWRDYIEKGHNDLWPVSQVELFIGTFGTIDPDITRSCKHTHSARYCALFLIAASVHEVIAVPLPQVYSQVYSQVNSQVNSHSSNQIGAETLLLTRTVWLKVKSQRLMLRISSKVS